ncbi:hypothetical protein QBC39DRAFT_356424 [Podospora conica]|nr:hypothetical protein QBC39DRAFT_356424 [Schizothecium conicum]
MPKQFLGEIDVVFVTADFPDSECFAPFEKYRITPRLPSSPGVPLGLSLARDSTHFGWVREHSRGVVEQAVKDGKAVMYVVLDLGKR